MLEKHACGRQSVAASGTDRDNPVVRLDNVARTGYYQGFFVVDDREQRFSEVGKAWWWFDLNLQRSIAIAGQDLNLTLEVTNLFNQRNAAIVNPVTGQGYPNLDAGTDFTTLRGDSDYDVLNSLRDPRYEDPNTSGLPPLNPARYLPQRHVLLGLSFEF